MCQLGKSQLGKSHRFHLSTSHIPSEVPFHLVYSDVWGPAPITSNNGNCYFIQFLDDCSKFVWIYFMKAKSQVYKIVKHFYSMVETQFGYKIKQMQTDWGGEYRNVSTFLHGLGINHRLSAPHTQEQNGAPECRNKFIIEKGLALLAKASLPLAFWEYAFSTTVYLTNRLITPVLQNKSPYQILYNRVPDYLFLKAFGCLCYPFLRPYNKHKLEYRSQPCIFIGYSSRHKAYMCFHPSTNRIYIVRHVVFDEQKFPYPTLIEQSPPSLSTPTISISLFPLEHASTLRTCTSPPDCFHTGGPSSSQSSVPLSINSDSNMEFDSPSPTNITLSSGASTFSTPTTGSSVSAFSSPTPSTTTIPTPPPPPPPEHLKHLRPSTTNTHPMITRAHTQSLKPKIQSEYKALTAQRSCSSSKYHTEQDPTSFSKASKFSHWRAAMEAEYQALMKNDTWELVPRPSDANILRGKWVYKTKRNSDGSIERHKARYVVRGFEQKAGVDFFETFSPVIKPTTIRLVLSIALAYGWNIKQLDVNNAFLNGDLSETVYIEQPQGFVNSHFPNYVCRLKKALYGLRQAPRAWFTKLKDFLHQHDFQGCYSDSSLFVRSTNSSLTYILVYVDDIIITGNDSSFITSFIHVLNQSFSLKDLGDLNYFLGIEVHRLPTGICLTQSKYIRELLQRTHMDNAKSTSSPAESGS